MLLGLATQPRLTPHTLHKDPTDPCQAVERVTKAAAAEQPLLFSVCETLSPALSCGKLAESCSAFRRGHCWDSGLDDTEEVIR